jgi:hypothetical protein
MNEDYVSRFIYYFVVNIMHFLKNRNENEGNDLFTITQFLDRFHHSVFEIRVTENCIVQVIIKHSKLPKSCDEFLDIKH